MTDSPIAKLDLDLVMRTLSKKVETVIDKLKEGKELSDVELIVLYLHVLNEKIDRMKDSIAQMGAEIKGGIGDVDKKMENLGAKMDKMAAKLAETGKPRPRFAEFGNFANRAC